MGSFRLGDILLWMVIGAVIVAAVANAGPVGTALNGLFRTFVSGEAVLASGGKYTPPN